MGIKTQTKADGLRLVSSEKPPHHMGIKTDFHYLFRVTSSTSEKPPHHMGIKTLADEVAAADIFSEKPPHHMGIKTRQ